MVLNPKIRGLFKGKSLDLNDPAQRQRAMELCVDQYIKVWREGSDPAMAAEKLVPVIRELKELSLDTLPLFLMAVRQNPADMSLSLHVAAKLMEMQDESEEAVEFYRRVLHKVDNPHGVIDHTKPQCDECIYRTVSHTGEGILQ